MKIDILTLFPNMFEALNSSILKKAQDKNLVEINVVNIRDFSQDRHKKCDDYPYGGGAGMLMTPQPLYDAIQSVKTEKSYVIYMSPCGNVLNQSKVTYYSTFEHIIIICGHYEGIDQRIIDLCVDEEVSIGDYVLTGGEIPAMAVVDALCRYIPDVLHSGESVLDESFSNGLLEYPQYTRPEIFQNLKVPEVLLSGNHKMIDDWRKKMSLKRTKQQRPDLIDE